MRTVFTAVRAPLPPPPAADGVDAPAPTSARAFHPGETDLLPVNSPAASPAPAPPPRDTVVPLTATLRRLNVTVSKGFVDKLAAARDAKRKGLVEKPRAAKAGPPSDPRYVPAEVRRADWKRDGGRCQWPMPGGGVCGSTYQVEIDHVWPVALGGESTVEYTRCACKPHNDEAARQVFGDEWMDRFTRRKGKARRGAPAGSE